MTRKNRTKLNLVAAVAVTILGVLFVMASNALFQFRLDGGWSYVEDANKILQVIHVLVVMAIEGLTGIVGIASAVFGCTIIYLNVNDLRKGR